MGVCDNCGRDTSDISQGLRGTFGGSDDWYEYLCMGCWRQDERSDEDRNAEGSK